jgi:kynurenine formamidase
MNVPKYAALPCIDALGLKHAWDVFGRDDNLGTLNLIDGSAVLRGFSAALTGDRFALALPLTSPDPPLFGRRTVAQSLVELDRNTWDDRLDSFYPQASSQWDGLKHVRCREFGFYTGLTSDPGELGERLGIDHWAAGIISRGVLLDLPRHRERVGRAYDPLAGEAIDAAELADIAAAQGVTVEQGDVLCVRLGWLTAYRGLSLADRSSIAQPEGELVYSGLSGGELMAEQLWDWHVAALVCDNPSIEVRPGDPTAGSLHRRVLPLLGMALGELFDFDQLAQACAADDRWTFTFIGVPHRMPGGLGSPANAVAVR